MKKTLLSTLFTLAVCLALLSTAALAAVTPRTGADPTYLDANGNQKAFTPSFYDSTPYAGWLESGCFYALDGDLLNPVQVEPNASLVLLDGGTLTISSLTSYYEGSSLNIYVGALISDYTSDIQGTGTCSIASISGVAVTLYGGTYTSLPANGWQLGAGYCFRTETEGSYTYSATHPGTAATVVKCSGSHVWTSAHTTCDICGAFCPHAAVTEGTNQCAACGTAVKVQLNVDGVTYGGESLSALMGKVNTTAESFSSNVFTLLADVTEASSLALTSHIKIELGGHTLGAALNIQQAQTALTNDISSTNGAVTGKVTISGSGSAVLGNDLTLRGGIETTVAGKTLQDYLATFCYFGTPKEGGGYDFVNGNVSAITDSVMIVHHPSHEYDNDGNCVCGAQASVSCTVNDTTVYHTTASDALRDSLVSGTVVKLLKDAELGYYGGSDRSFTLDLNGHKVTTGSTPFTIGSGVTMTLQDSSTGSTGEFNGTLQLDAGSALTLSTAKMPQGTLALNGGAVSLSGGTFGSITRTDECEQTLAAILADGYSYVNATTREKLVPADDATKIENATVVDTNHAHTLGENGSCGTCNVKLAAKLDMDGNTSYHLDLSGIGSAILGKAATIDLLANAAGNLTVSGEGTTPTLNLNGKTMTGALAISSGNVTVTANDGAISGAVSLTGGYLTINGGTYSGNVTASGGTLAITGGTFNRVEVKETGTVRLTGGTFTTLTAGNDLKGCLAENYAFASKDDPNVGVSASGTNASNVTVVPHLIHPDEDENGECDFCGRAFVAYIEKADLSRQYFDTFASALENVQAGQTVQLLGNVSLTQHTSITGKSFTLNLGKKELGGSATLTIASGAELTLKGATGKLTAPIEVNGKLTVADTVTLGSVSVFDGGVLIVNANANFTSLSITGGNATLNAGTFATLAVGTNEKIGDKPFLGADRAYFGSAWLTDTELDASSITNVSVKAVPFKGLTITAGTNVTGDQTTGFRWDYGKNANFSVFATDSLTTSADTQGVALSGTYVLKPKQGEAGEKSGSITAELNQHWIAKASHFDGADGLAQAALLQISGAPLPAGSYTLEITVTATGHNDYSETVSIPVTVDKATVQYSAPTANAALTYSAQEQTLISAPSAPEGATVQYRLSPSADWSAELPKAKNAETYTVYWQILGGENYNDLTGTTPLTVTIAPKDISTSMQTRIVYVSVPDLTFIGQAQTPTPVLQLKSKGDGGTEVVLYETLVEDTDYTVTVTPETNADDYELTLTGKGNYTGERSCDWVINKASAPTLNNIPVSQKYTVTGEQSKQLGSLMPVNAGTLSYVKGSTSTTTGISSWSVDAATGTVNYTLDGSGAGGTTITLPVTIRSTNYADATVNVVVTLTEKDAQEALTITSPDTATYHTMLQLTASGGSGSGRVSWSVVNGSGSAVINDGSILYPTGAGTVTVTATRAGDNSYNEISSEPMTITIAPLQISGEPLYAPITTGGKTLGDAALRKNESWNKFSSRFGWVDKDGNPLPDSTEVQQNTAYTWRLLLDESEAGNCTPMMLNGEIVLWRKSAPPAAASGKHHITVDDTENGSVTVEPSGAKAGETVSVTVTPDAGYTVEDITITDRSGNKVKFTRKGDKYTFEMPESGVSIKVSFTRSENPFVDVPEGKYFYDAVLWALENGITGGTDATHFSPYASCTRGQLVTFLWRAAGEPTAKNAASFTDVAAGRYCEDAVAWAAENGIVGGYDDGAFRPDATITRQQTAAILWRFAKYAGMDVSVGEDTNILSYSDALSISDYAFPAIQWAVGAEVMGGSNGSLLPGNVCNRAQIVTMLYRSLAE